MKSILIMSLIFLVSCSSSIVKEKPNFNLQGHEAKKEREKFTLKNLTIHGGQFEEEGIFTSFKMKEFKDTLKDVSPKSAELIEDTRGKDNFRWVIFGAWLATVFIKDSDGNISPLYWWGAGATFGYMFYLQHYRDKAMDQYNEDLKMKFAPSVGYKFTF